MFIYTFTLAYWMHVANLFCAISRERANRDLNTEGEKDSKCVPNSKGWLIYFSSKQRKKKHFLLIKFTLDLYVHIYIIFKLYLNQIMPSGCWYNRSFEDFFSVFCTKWIEWMEKKLLNKSEPNWKKRRQKKW